MQSSLSHHPQKPLTVLLVDDDGAFAKVVQLNLQKYQDRVFKLLWKDTIEDALTEVRENSTIDLILTDYHFPGSNGLEFCLQLNEEKNRIPIVFVTSTKDIKLAVEAMKLGVEDFLVKDELTESLLARTVINVLDRVHMRHQIEAVEKRMMIAEKRAEAIRELVVTVCHEFNNPLAAIKISADLIQRLPLSKEEKNLLTEFEQDFARIEQEIRRLRDINFERIDFQSIQPS
jgi:FixJ family two-component response regulator